jgi:LuxR family maltose regulon positive regulatory protein
MGEETAPAVTEGNFRLNLHRLRKILEPGLDKSFGSSYIHAKANLLCLDRELCTVDADEFLSLCQQGEQREEVGDPKAALAAYRAALELYRGDFLAEEPYAAWAELRRERLRRAFIDLLYRLAAVYERQGAFMRAVDCLKRLIQTDAWEEQAYQRLMLLYVSRRMRTAALRTYADCLKALRDGLNTTPDAVTTAIYQKIVETH